MKDMGCSITIIVMTLALSGCSLIMEKSKFNSASEHMNRVSKSNIIENEEFKINMPMYLTNQIQALEKQVIPKYNPKTNPLSSNSACKSQGVLKIPSSLETLASNRVVSVILNTVSIGNTQSLNAVAYELDDLGFADFENFRRMITDAVHAKSDGLNLRGVATDKAYEKLFASLLSPPSVSTDRKDSPLLAYYGAYYHGKFVDRFGNSLEKPSIKNGIEDGTIASFIQVFTEFLSDLVEPKLPILIESSPVKRYYPKDKEPTFHKVFQGSGYEYEVKKSGLKGISGKESKVIETGANLIANQGLTLFSGFLELLSEIHVGFIIAGNFSVGSNDTLKTVARSVIETALRRGAERALYCLMEKYDFDTVADIIDKSL
jgi:hypothetical protein